MKDGENSGRRAAVLKLGGEGMNTNVLFSALLVGFKRIVDDWLEVERWGRGGVRVRHGA